MRNFRLALSASLVAVAAFALSGDALAHGKPKFHKHDHRSAHRAPVVVVPAPVRPAFTIRPVLVPQRIVFQNARTFAPYRYGTVWVPAHRHHHVLYRFPVATPYGVTYQSHAYCDGHRYGIVTGPVLHDDRPHGYISIGGENVRIGIGF